MKNKDEGFLSEKINIVNIISILVSIFIILLAYVPYGIAGAETILISIGCSGMAAGIMAIFLNLAQRSQEDKKNKLLKKYNLSQLHYEMKSMFERLIWIDEVINSHELDKEMDYYLSSDFLSEAYSFNVYRKEDYKQFHEDVKRLCAKYKKEEWKDTEKITYAQAKRMFGIIGNASLKINDELKRINLNSSFLIANSILSNEELRDLNNNISQNVDFLCVKDTNYGTHLTFLWKAYETLRNTDCFNDEIYLITWHPKDDIQDLLLQDRQQKGNSEIEITYIGKWNRKAGDSLLFYNT